MSVSPFEDPLFTGLIGDPETANLFSSDQALVEMITFETALAEAEGAEGVIPAETADVIAARLAEVELDRTALAAGVAIDGVVVPELVRQLRESLPANVAGHVHFGATSQDVIDTSLALRLKRLGVKYDAQIDRLVAALDTLEARDGAAPVMAHTRMQAAIPVTASRKIASWRDPLVRDRHRLTTAISDVAVLHFGGAAGTLEKLGSKGPAVAARMAQILELGLPDRARHSERDGIAALASVLSLLAGSLGKFGQDIALLAQSEVGEVRLASGGGSSAMPHKMNPVQAEMLVTLARFNATLLAGMHQALVHEGERSGSAWTLEWMLLPQMAVATASSLRLATELAGSISFQATA